jgi:hypothetical protein
MNALANSAKTRLNTTAIPVNIKKWEMSKLPVRRSILLKSSFPPIVYANKKVLPCPGSRA